MRRILLILALAACRRAPTHDDNLAAMVAACTGKDLACPRPILYVGSLAASQQYYRDKLGFHIDWTDGDPPDFGAVTRGDTQIFMCERCQGHPGGWMFIMTPDVDKLHAELVRRGARIKAVPENKPWGVREMQVTDPDGNVLRIAGPKK
jgi:catechol 2,3-dioxygenase-like lactoylglutathione lyase family enzyme